MEQVEKCQKNRSHIAEFDIWRWTIGLGRALKALHGMNIFHRDMKSANIFLSSTPNGRIAKLGDFNVSTVAKNRLCLTQTGTPYYASPEVWRDMPYDGKSDMWGLGCVVYEAAGLQPPFKAEDMEGLAHKVCVGKYRRIPSVFSNELSEVIGLLLQVNPRHRPTPSQLLGLPLINKHAGVLKLEEDDPCETDLLATIKVPRNMQELLNFQSCLPVPKYGGRIQVDASHQGDTSPGALVESPKLLDPLRYAAVDEHSGVAKSNPVNGENHKILDKLRRAGGARLARCRSDVALPRKRRGLMSHAQVEQGDCASLHDSPQGPVNLLPRIQLNELASRKGLPKGLRLKLPRIASCRGQLA